MNALPALHFRRFGAFSASLLVGAAALAACSSSPKLPSSSHSTSTSSTKGTNGKSTTGTSAPKSKVTVPPGSTLPDTTTTVPVAGAPVGPTCTKSQLEVTQVGQQQNGTMDVGVYDVTNSSKSRCSLSGYPTLLLIGSLGPLKTNVTDGGVAGQPVLPVTAVTLSPKGGQASFFVSWTPRTSPTQASCPDGNSAQVTLPSVSGTLTLTTFITACGGNLNVSPLRPNVAIPK